MPLLTLVALALLVSPGIVEAKAVETLGFSLGGRTALLASYARFWTR